MRKLLLLIALLFAVSSIVAACGDSYDEEGFDLVRNYAEDIIPATDSAVLYVTAWLGDPTDGNFESASEAVEEINDINNQYWGNYEGAEGDNYIGQKYDVDEINNWGISMSRGENESWIISGDDLSAAVYDMEDASDFLYFSFTEIEDPNEVDESEIERLEWSLSDAEEEMNNLRQVLFNR